MRDYPRSIMLNLDRGRWGVLVAALQEKRSLHINRMREAVARGEDFRVAAETDIVRETNELLALVDPEGERQETAMDERLQRWAEEAEYGD